MSSQVPVFRSVVDEIDGAGGRNHARSNLIGEKQVEPPRRFGENVPLIIAGDYNRQSRAEICHCAAPVRIHCIG